MHRSQPAAAAGVRRALRTDRLVRFSLGRHRADPPSRPSAVALPLLALTRKTHPRIQPVRDVAFSIDSKEFAAPLVCVLLLWLSRLSMLRASGWSLVPGLQLLELLLVQECSPPQIGRGRVHCWLQGLLIELLMAEDSVPWRMFPMTRQYSGSL